MKLKALLLAAALAGPALAATTPDQQLDALSERAMQNWFAASPSFATFIGAHRYDAQLDDLGAPARARALTADRAVLKSLDAIDAAKLDRQHQVDALILRNQLQQNLWTAETLQDWAWDPQLYSQLVGNALYTLMARDYAPLPQRLRAATKRLELLPRVYAQMRANLDPARVPKVHAETVAKQNSGVKELIATFITPHVKELKGAERARLQAAIRSADKAVDEQQRWLDQTLVPNARGDFRLGAALYDQKLRFALMSSLSREEIAARARAELKRVRGEMYAIARQLIKHRDLPEQPVGPEMEQQAIEMALELAYGDHSARESLMADATAALGQARQFVIDRHIVTVPETPVRIIPMPEFQQGVAVAYCDSPGPLDKNQPTFYAISPIPKDWSDSQVESFLREYNGRMVHLLSIHEGMPGHYLEGAHSAEHSPSKLRSVLRSGLFAEGWAVYMERVMREAGYMDSDPLFHLVQLKFYLRTIGNSLLDQGVHVEGWTREQAMDFMVKQTFQQEREAAGKWVRAQLSSAQLPTYFVGLQEQLDMRRAVEAAWGPQRFQTLQAYHDQVLSYGAPPTRFVRELMLDEPIR
ncbi:DUF885 domain-containing protein [Pelomonas sp. KK5]|uniref:DUF885 domain-containing protein n=1 Tax=Pelomonas sp. KK5 TaxID=1855730 RepID=UPI00097BD140|nr:DUF885 domain-containing protein [Pelomonas sp. KK5]